MIVGTNLTEKEKAQNHMGDLLRKRDYLIHAGFYSIYGFVGSTYATMTTPSEQVEAIKKEFDIIMEQIKAIDTEYEALRAEE